MVNKLAESGPAAPLTPRDIQALRAAGSIRFFYGPAESGMIAIENQENEEGERRSIPTDVRVVNHDSGSRVVSASHLIIYAKLHEPWLTACQLIRPGSRLEVIFGADSGTNGNMEEYGLHGDRLLLVVQRGKKKLSFLLTQVTSRDGWGRMVQTRKVEDGCSTDPAGGVKRAG